MKHISVEVSDEQYEWLKKKEIIHSTSISELVWFGLYCSMCLDRIKDKHVEETIERINKNESETHRLQTKQLYTQGYR